MRQKIIMLLFLAIVVHRILFTPGKRYPMRIRCDGGER